ncbi:acyl carrier protein [Allocatelliglobosispora scoriae]|uniref:Acyl carrier protein n=1 Tax=Allocatelliglobosispora scoriae TaxID=643052 RepID=A0A841C1B6_9ACTN|nr:acyl carrier protein [Allocatelliglobosispora scoriae]MBB5872852.1 acyl carrier protein [Allocatelliglobosispora scoriae]
MSTETFTQDDLMTLLVAKVGLPDSARTDDPSATFADVGLDSLAYLQMQAELAAGYAVEIPGDQPLSFSFGDIVTAVNARPALVEEGSR